METNSFLNISKKSQIIFLDTLILFDFFCLYLSSKEVHDKAVQKIEYQSCSLLNPKSCYCIIWKFLSLK